MFRFGKSYSINYAYCFFFYQWTPILRSPIVVEDSSVRTSGKFIHFRVTHNLMIQSLRSLPRIQCKTDPENGILIIWHTPYPDHKFAFNTFILVLQLLVSKNLILSIRWSRRNEYCIYFAVVTSGLAHGMSRYIIMLLQPLWSGDRLVGLFMV